MPLTVELVTPRGSLLREEVDVVSAPTPQGEISVLAHHVPLLSALVAGELRLRRGADTQSFAVAGGVLEVREGSRVVVLADFAERAEGIAEAAAEVSYRQAQELARETKDDRAFAAATAVMERELARLRLARKTKHRRSSGRFS